MTGLSRRDRARVYALGDRLEKETDRLTQDVIAHPQLVGPVVVEDYALATGRAHALERRLSAIGPGPAEDPDAYLARGGSEHLQPPGTVDLTGFCDGVV